MWAIQLLFSISRGTLKPQAQDRLARKREEVYFGFVREAAGAAAVLVGRATLSIIGVGGKDEKGSFVSEKLAKMKVIRHIPPSSPSVSVLGGRFPVTRLILHLGIF